MFGAPLCVALSSVSVADCSVDSVVSVPQWSSTAVQALSNFAAFDQPRVNRCCISIDEGQRGMKLECEVILCGFCMRANRDPHVFQEVVVRGCCLCIKSDLHVCPQCL